MEKYDIKRNPKPLTDEQINKYKDFDKLINSRSKLHKYKDVTKPLYKNWKLMSFVVLICSVLLVLILENQNTEHPAIAPENSDTISNSKPTNADSVQIKTGTSPTSIQDAVRITSPTIQEKPIDLSGYELFEILPAAGATLYTKTGRRMRIEPFSFETISKEKTAEKVLLLYREFADEIAAGTEKIATNIPVFIAEIKGMEAFSKKPVYLTNKLSIEIITNSPNTTGIFYQYGIEDKNWIVSNDPTHVYRYLLFPNKSEFPETAHFENIFWELPLEIQQSGNFNFIFNRPWKNYSFNDSKNEFTIKNTNTSFIGTTKLAALHHNGKINSELTAAFIYLYNFTVGKETDKEKQKESVKIIEDWKNSPEGKDYFSWTQNTSQIETSKNTSIVTVKAFGKYLLAYPNKKSTLTNSNKRILYLEKNPEKTQLFKNELMEKDPTLKR